MTEAIAVILVARTMALWGFHRYVVALLVSVALEMVVSCVPDNVADDGTSTYALFCSTAAVRVRDIRDASIH